ncbi:hypothetical protein AWC38_SpisGene24199, partial [Stylophora pistillata]
MEVGRLGVDGVNAANSVIVAPKTAQEVAQIHLPEVVVVVLGNLEKRNPATHTNARKCDSSRNTSWTNDNALSCDDGNACTKNDRCSAGKCIGTPLNCLSPCEECYNDACRMKSGYCLIFEKGTKTCVSDGNSRSGRPCQKCDTSKSVSTWSDNDGAACDDGNICTRSDKCSNGQCKGTPLTCNSICQTCNGNSCGLKTGYGFSNGKCKCKINGRDYDHHILNPSNPCQWCDLLDVTARASSTWSNRNGAYCDDKDKCTKRDVCNAGSCKGQSYSCQSSYPSSSCIRTSECVGDGSCRDIMRTKGTVCRSANDMCDQTETCDGRLGICPAFVVDSVTVTTGTVKIVDQNFHNTIFYQHVTDKLFVTISGFNVSCGKMNLRWFLLPGASSCSGSSLANGIIQSTNNLQTLSGLTLQDGKSYKISIAASDLRDKIQHRECSSAVIVDTSKPTHGWVHDGEADDLDYQSSKLFQVNWGGFQTRNGIDNYDWKVLLTSYGSSPNTELTTFFSAHLSTHMDIRISNITDGSKVQFVVRAYTKAGLYGEVKSNGIIFDNTPPVAGKVFAGADNNVKYATWRKKFYTNWNPFNDPHTTMWRYTCAIKKQGNQLSTAYRDNALNRSATFSELALISGEKYCAVVRGYNNAGLYTEATSDWVLIDYDAPLAGN